VIKDAAIEGLGDAELLRSAVAELRAALPKSAARLERSSLRPALWTTRERFWSMPIYVDRGVGSHVVDVDGRDYIDCNMGHGPLILGHCHPRVVAAIDEQLARGNHFGPPSVHEMELAELIVRGIPGGERVAFMNSGTEAAMAAVRIARAATGRRVVAKCEGGLHGSYEPLRHSVLSFTGAPARPEPSPDVAGMPPSLSADVLVLPFNDEVAFDLVRQAGERIACVVVEPLQGSAGTLPPSPGFLQGLRKACDEVGAIFVMDEVITGFRLGPRSGAGRFGVRADLTVLGKAVGGGLPIGAVCGSARLVDLTAAPPEHPANEAVVVGGTFSGNPLTSVAGVAQLCELLEQPDSYERLDALGERMREGLSKVLAEEGVRGFVTGMASIWGGPYFTDELPTTYRGVATADQIAGRLLSIYLLLDGVLVTSPSHLNFVSTVHTEEEVDTVVEAYRRALARLLREGALVEEREGGTSGG
jgi:glutamate-1-semialdehyde 2,1-aminomutase